MSQEECQHHLNLTDQDNSAEESGSELLARMARKESGAWQTFFDLYGDMIYGQVYHVIRRYLITLPEGLVEDTVQSLFLKLLEQDGRKLLLYEDRKGASLAGWLRTVATTHAIEVIRGRRRHVSFEEEPEVHKIQCVMGADSADEIRENLELEQQLAILEQAVSELPGRDRLLFRLYYQEERNRNEIALILELEPNHVDQLLYRIREKLKSQVKTS